MNELVNILKIISEGGLKNDEAILTLVQAVITKIEEMEREIMKNRSDNLKLLGALGDAVELLSNKVIDLDNKLSLLGYESVRRH